MYVVSLEGVLKNDTDQPISDGVRLYRTLVDGAKVIVATDGPIAKANHWLRSHGLLMHDGTVGDETALPGMDIRLRQVETMRLGSAFVTVIEADPERALALMDAGVTVLLFAQAKMVNPKNRLDRATTKKWSDLEQELDNRQSVGFQAYE